MKKVIRDVIIVILLSVVGFSFLGCNIEPKETWVPEEGDYRDLAAFMTAYFNNLNQHQSNPTYYVIELRQKRIWDTKTSGIWVYIEQGYSELDPDYNQYSVYRQRVYNIVETDTDEVTSYVYGFKDSNDEDMAVRAWEDEKPLSHLSTSDFEKKEGCEVILTKTGDGQYEGGTVGKECLTAYPGATYATSVVTIDIGNNTLTSLDRFYNSSDQQVGGASSPYIFDVIENYNQELDSEE